MTLSAKSIITCLALLPCLPLEVMSQVSLSKADVCFLGGDYQRYGISYVDPGEGGDNCCWDFSELAENGVFNFHVKDTLNFHVLTGHDDITYYRVDNDSLLEVGRENPLVMIHYDKPVGRLVFPIAYKDSAASDFEGHGVYCEDHYFKEAGSNKYVVDACGMMVLPGGDTVRNVLRVHSLRSFLVKMMEGQDEDGLAKSRSVIEEKYSWYIRGCHHPILETTASCSYENSIPVGGTRTAYHCFPAVRQALFDAKDNAATIHGENIPGRDIIHYGVEVEGGKLTVSYDMEERAGVSMILANNLGVVFASENTVMDKGENYQTSFDLGGLHDGVYILYISAGGKTYSETIKK